MKLWPMNHSDKYGPAFDACGLSGFRLLTALLTGRQHVGSNHEAVLRRYQGGPNPCGALSVRPTQAFQHLRDASPSALCWHIKNKRAGICTLHGLNPWTSAACGRERPIRVSVYSGLLED